MRKYTDTGSNVSGNTVHVLKPLAPEQKAMKLESFSVTTDSVVATANLVFNESHEIIRIWWGDEGENDQPETIDLRKERLVLDNPASANSLRLQHAYDVDSLRKIILVQTQDSQGKISWDTAVITLEPRYKFIIYPVKLEINSHLDTIFESDSELEVYMKVIHNDQTILDEQWKADITTQVEIGPFFPIFYTLEGSRVNLEISYHDDPIDIECRVKETDGLVKDVLQSIWDFFHVEFDTSVQVPDYDGGPFHPRVYTGSKEFRFSHVLDDGTVIVIFSTEMNLIVPLDQSPLSVLAPS
jgi:hypothetical protein